MATCNEKRCVDIDDLECVDIDDLEPDMYEKCIKELTHCNNNYSSNKTVDIDDLEPDKYEECRQEIKRCNNNYSSNKTAEPKIHQPEDEQIATPETPIADAAEEKNDPEETEQQQDNDPSQQPKSNSSVFILSYALDEMSWGVTPRGVLLLSYVDVKSNPCGEIKKRSSAYFNISTLEIILNADRKTVQRTIKDLVTRGLLTASKVKYGTWKLETPKRDRKEKGGIQIPPLVRGAFERGELKPGEMLMLSKIASFTRCGKPCFACNRRLGEYFSISAETTQGIIRNLRNKGWLNNEYWTNEGNKDKPYRVLIPTNKELWKKGVSFG